MRRRAGAGPALVAVLALAGCGLPTGGEAHPVDATQVPYGLLGPTPVSTAGIGAPGTVRATQPAVYLLAGDTTLVPVAAPSLPVKLTTQERLEVLLKILASGPGETQRRQGLGTALAPAAGLRLVQLDASTAVVQLDVTNQPSPERLPLAVGQVVLTATSVPGVDAVQVLANGTPVEVPLPGGALTSEPLHRSDYRELLRPPSPTASPATAPTATP